jgi:HK97 family phage prohead protease
VEYKRFPVDDFEFKAGGDQPGYFKALVAVFNNVDDGGDRIIPGAFRKSLKSNPRPPIIWSHRWEIPPIGQTLKAKETESGLEIEGQLLLDDDGISGDYARSVLSGFKAGALKEFSFAFDVTDSEEVEEKGKTVRELKALNVFEVGPTLIGMNRETALLEVASNGLNVVDDIARKVVTLLLDAEQFKAGLERLSADTKAAIAPHNTSVVDGTWDKSTAMMACSNSDDPAAAFRSICAWYSGSNPDQRQSYKFPHHATPGGPANLNGVRNGLSRVSQADIPSGDVAGVQRHLNHHLEAAKAAATSPDDESRAAALAEYRQLLSLVPR